MNRLSLVFIITMVFGFAWYVLLSTKPTVDAPEDKTPSITTSNERPKQALTSLSLSPVAEVDDSNQTTNIGLGDTIRTCANRESSQSERLNISTVFKSLSDSFDTQDKLTFIIFNNGIDPKEKLEQLYQYHTNFPSDGIAYYQLLNSCHVTNDKERCKNELFDFADQVDVNNGMLNINIAALKIKQGDYSSALQHIRSAADKTYFSEYYYRSLELFSSSVSNYSPDTFLESVVAAIGYAAAQPAHYGVLFEHCMKSSETDLELMDACFQLGKSMSQNSHTIMLQGLGNALVTEYFLKSADNDAALESEYESELITAQNFNKDTFNVLNLIFSDEDLVRLWLQVGKEQGEAEATKQLIQEAKWRSQDPNYNPCQSQVVQ